MKAIWILKNGSQTTECTSFPYAFRAAWNAVRTAGDEKKNVGAVMQGISILGPPNLKGDRTKYSYSSACSLARGQGLLSPDNQLNSREFKKR